jgi:hypothetical protein
MAHCHASEAPKPSRVWNLTLGSIRIFTVSAEKATDPHKSWSKKKIARGKEKSFLMVFRHSRPGLGNSALSTGISRTQCVSCAPLRERDTE